MDSNLAAELQALLDNRKWCQLLEIFDEKIDIYPKEIVQFVLDHISPLCNHTHLPTLMVLICHICDFYFNLELLNQLIETLSSVQIPDQETQDALFICKINLLIYEQSKDIYEYFDVEASNLCKERLFLLFYLYFKNVNNYSNSFNYLFEYLKMIKNNKKIKNTERFNQLNLDLGEMAIQSDNVYSFDEVIDFLPDLPIKKILIAYNQGNIQFVKQNSIYPADKVYLKAMLRYFSYKQRITIDEISESIQVSRMNALLWIFTALGKQLIQGYFDGEKNELVLFKGVNQLDTAEDLKNMKEVFISWRSKVNKVIESL